MNDITRMPLSSLYDLLSIKTLSLLEAMNKRDKPSIVLALKFEVQTIQSEIANRKSSNLKINRAITFSKN
jgi:hypothetical protein